MRGWARIGSVGPYSRDNSGELLEVGGDGDRKMGDKFFGKMILRASLNYWSHKPRTMVHSVGTNKNTCELQWLNYYWILRSGRSIFPNSINQVFLDWNERMTLWHQLLTQRLPCVLQHTKQLTSLLWSVLTNCICRHTNTQQVTHEHYGGMVWYSRV